MSVRGTQLHFMHVLTGYRRNNPGRARAGVLLSLANAQSVSRVAIGGDDGAHAAFVMTKAWLKRCFVMVGMRRTLSNIILGNGKNGWRKPLSVAG